MIKKITLFVVVLFTAFSVNAQIQKGRFLVGGTSNLSFLSSKSTYRYDGTTTKKIKISSFEFSPEVGYFIMDKLAIGLDLSYSSEKEKVDNEAWSDPSRTFGMAFFGKYYFEAGSFKPFGKAQLGYLHIAGSDNDVNKFNGVALGVAAGAAYFINDLVAFEASLGYDYAKVKNVKDNKYEDKVGGFGLNIGIVVTF